MEAMTDVLFWGSAGAVFVASFLKGTLAIGFPLVATPLIALLSDVPTAVVITLVPNISMDIFQSFSRPWRREDIHRLLPLILAGVAGIQVGTKLLATLSGPTLRLWLGLVVLAFAVSQLLPWKLSVPRSNLPLWSAVVGAVSGVVGGMTNVFTPVVIIFYAVGMDKATFVQSVGATFLVFKMTQVVTTYHFALWTPALATLALPLTGIALLGFWCGRHIHTRLPERAFRQGVLLAISVAGVGLVLRSLGQ